MLNWHVLLYEKKGNKINVYKNAMGFFFRLLAEKCDDISVYSEEV